MSDNEHSPLDPLGLEALGRIIAAAKGGASGVDHIERVFQSVKSSYAALQDRYRLLKESNRLLAEEVAWLRDQCDDFAQERSELMSRLSHAHSDGKRPESGR